MTVKEKNKTMGTLKYKVGDKVRIKSKGWYLSTVKASEGVMGGTFPFEDRMSEFCGKETRVAKIETCALGEFYALEIDGLSYAWEDWMLDVAQDTKSEISEEKVKVIGRYISAMRSYDGYNKLDIDIPVIIAMDKIIMVEASANGKYSHVSVENMSDTICLKCTINEIMSIMGQTYSPVPVMSC